MSDGAVVADSVQRDTSGPGPLAGVRVVELGVLLAGPFTGRLLGDMGAEIIKIEPPGKPDPMREWGHARYEGRSLWWPVQSRNKKCVTLDLRQERGQSLLVELAKRSDVLVDASVRDQSAVRGDVAILEWIRDRVVGRLDSIAVTRIDTHLAELRANVADSKLAALTETARELLKIV